MSQTFAIISGLLFVVPFFIWGAIRFFDNRDKTKYLHWKNKVILISFLVFISLSITFFVLAIIFWS